MRTNSGWIKFNREDLGPNSYFIGRPMDLAAYLILKAWACYKPETIKTTFGFVQLMIGDVWTTESELAHYLATNKTRVGRILKRLIFFNFILIKNRSDRRGTHLSVINYSYGMSESSDRSDIVPTPFRPRVHIKNIKKVINKEFKEEEVLCKNSVEVETPPPPKNSEIGLKVWNSFASEFFDRYGTRQESSEKVVAMAKDFGLRVGFEAPQVIKYYVRHCNENIHSLGRALKLLDELVSNYRGFIRCGGKIED
jgi:hypothetical protein